MLKVCHIFRTMLKSKLSKNILFNAGFLNGEHITFQPILHKKLSPLSTIGKASLLYGQLEKDYQFSECYCLWPI
jgi:hypothetical protein